jgi:hypothetical protein
MATTIAGKTHTISHPHYRNAIVFGDGTVLATSSRQKPHRVFASEAEATAELGAMKPYAARAKDDGWDGTQRFDAGTLARIKAISDAEYGRPKTSRLPPAPPAHPVASSDGDDTQ